MASPPLEQADTVEKFGPFVPSTIEIWPEAMSGSIIGTRNGLTLDAPLASMTPICSDSVMIPPIPLATITAVRSALVASISRPACSTASSEAATPNCTNLSIRRASLRPT